jgi:acyl carrier protein
VKELIIAYIADEILGEEAPAITEYTSLLSSGLLDSLSVEQLLLYLEDELGVEFHDADYSAENFETVAAIGDLLLRKTAVPSPDVDAPLTS